MSRPTDKYWETLPPDFLRKKYEEYPDNPQYTMLAKVLSLIGGSALDVGCASCIMYPTLKASLDRYVGVDITEKFLNQAKNLYPEIEVHQASVLDLPFPDRSFDTVFCKSLMLHLPPGDMPYAIIEMMRVASTYTVIGFHRAPGPQFESIIRDTEQGGCFYNIYRKRDVEAIITTNQRFRTLRIIPTQYVVPEMEQCTNLKIQGAIYIIGLNPFG